MTESKSSPGKNTTPSSPKVETAEISWKENGQPFSPSFDDIYYSVESGLEETHHTFIQHNQLQERFAQLLPDQLFTIGETGFGTGLNFLCAWRLFDQLAHKSARLRFISTEKYPLTQEDLEHALRLWPELGHWAKQLVKTYTTATQGFQHQLFDSGRVSLTLLIGDALETLPSLEGKVDAWFLDGFNPAKNPSMWQPALFNAMAQKSHTGTSYATFTAARVVRDGLSEAGFSVEKVRGYGKKRDMIRGALVELATEAAPTKRPIWFQKPSSVVQTREAVVVGAGLAGASTAWSLAQRGWKVKLLDRHAKPAQEASGNPQGILYAKLSANNTPLSQFILQGYLYSINLLDTLSLQMDGAWHNGGVIQLSTTEKIHHRHQALAKYFPKPLLRFEQKESLSELAGLPLDYPGLFFPKAGWINPPRLCQTLASHVNIQLETGIEVRHLEKMDTGWRITVDGHDPIESPVVVVAGGASSNQLPPFQHIPLKAIRGQISEVAETTASSRLQCSICAEGYAAPAWQGRHTIGATFDFDNKSLDVLEESHQQNIIMMEQGVPSLYQALGREDLLIKGGRAGFRCTTPDYLPVIGRAVDPGQFLQDFAMLRKNVKHPFQHPPTYLDGLYINTGHGSRGLITCPLSGEILACMINNEASPVPTELLDQINPTRFLVRGMSRNKTLEAHG